MKREIMKTGEYKMKRTLACLTILTALCALPALAAPATLTGVVSCDMCAGKHMIPGKSDADCTRACIRRGAKLALAVNDKLYLLAGKTAQVDALAGQKATVKGDLNGNTLTVASITPAK
jgi:hypothetical protein